jgi:hypothetical protein
VVGPQSGPQTTGETPGFPQWTGWPGYGTPQASGPASGPLWPPVPPGYYQRPLKSPYDQRPPFRPGPIFCVVTALVLVPGIVGATGSDLGYLQAISVGIGLLIGGIWLLALITNSQESHFRYDRRSWVRWAIPPAIFFIAMAVICSPIPRTVRFDLSESALQQSASQTISDTSYGPRWVGLYEFYDIRVDGPIRYFDLTLPSDYSGRCSYVYAPQQTAAFNSWINAGWNVQSLGDSWWYGCDTRSLGD